MCVPNRCPFGALLRLETARVVFQPHCRARSLTEGPLGEVACTKFRNAISRWDNLGGRSVPLIDETSTKVSSILKMLITCRRSPESNWRHQNHC